MYLDSCVVLQNFRVAPVVMTIVTVLQISGATKHFRILQNHHLQCHRYLRNEKERDKSVCLFALTFFSWHFSVLFFLLRLFVFREREERFLTRSISRPLGRLKPIVTTPYPEKRLEKHGIFRNIACLFTKLDVDKCIENCSIRNNNVVFSAYQKINF